MPVTQYGHEALHHLHDFMENNIAHSATINPHIRGKWPIVYEQKDGNSRIWNPRIHSLDHEHASYDMIFHAAIADLDNPDVQPLNSHPNFDPSLMKGIVHNYLTYYSVTRWGKRKAMETVQRFIEKHMS